MMEETDRQQRAFCQEHSAPYVAAPPDSKLGFALKTIGFLPINGLRHPPEGETNGWYIWCGEVLLSNPDFLDPPHTRHLIDKCPQVIEFLGLPPGYRFMIANDHVDVWYDPTLLKV